MNRARKRTEWARVYGSTERVQFIKALPCCVSSCDRRPCENAHAKGGGMGRKADARFVLPLCTKHHRELHNIGVRTFEKRHAIDLLHCADWTEWRWQQAGDFADL